MFFLAVSTDVKDSSSKPDKDANKSPQNDDKNDSSSKPITKNYSHQNDNDDEKKK
jgi:hypothetical protein